MAERANSTENVDDSKFEEELRKKHFDKLNAAIAMADETISGGVLERLNNLRNKSLAHRTFQTRLDKSLAKKEVEPLPPAKYGDERVLLETAAAIGEAYYLAINGIDFNISMHRKMYRKRADAFWNGVKIEVLR